MQDFFSRTKWSVHYLWWTLLVFYLISTLFFPLDWGMENGLLESLQLVSIIIGTFISIWAASKYATHATNIRNFFLWSSWLWFVLLGRETSWGRIFTGYPRLFIFKVIAASIIGILVIIFFHFKIWHHCSYFLRQHDFPLGKIALVVILLVTASFIEHNHKINQIWSFKKIQVFEESLELFAYILCVDLNIWAIRILRRHKNTAPQSF